MLFNLFQQRIKMRSFVVLGIGLLFFVHAAYAGVHSYQYIYTATSGIPEFPEFVVVGSVDGQQVNYFDSEIKEVIPRQEWVKGAVDADFWKRNAQIFGGSQQVYKTDVEILKQRFNQTGVPPSVSLLQKTPSSPVTCHATGFYPSGVKVVWIKDGQEHHEDVENGETLPNDDGTFQKSTHLTVTPEEWKNNKYQCVVQVTGIKVDFIKVLTESEIQTNRGANEPNTIGSGPVIGVVVALLVIVVAVVGVVIWKKK